MNTQSEVQQTPNADALPVARLAYVPPKLEMLSAGETRLGVNPAGTDGIIYS